MTVATYIAAAVPLQASKSSSCNCRAEEGTRGQQVTGIHARPIASRGRRTDNLTRAAARATAKFRHRSAPGQMHARVVARVPA